MTNVFEDAATLAEAFGCTTDRRNDTQTALYLKLLLEEVGETLAAANPSKDQEISGAIRLLTATIRVDANSDRVGMFDGLVDVLVVTAGAGVSQAFPMQAGWDEVFRTNMAKVDPATGRVRRREDNKVLKPEGWRPPNLAALLHD